MFCIELNKLILNYGRWKEAMKRMMPVVVDEVFRMFDDGSKS